jgi:hypothetical protein
MQAKNRPSTLWTHHVRYGKTHLIGALTRSDERHHTEIRVNSLQTVGTFHYVRESSTREQYNELPESVAMEIRAK